MKYCLPIHVLIMQKIRFFDWKIKIGLTKFLLPMMKRNYKSQNGPLLACSLGFYDISCFRVIVGFQVQQRRLQRHQRRPPNSGLHLREVHLRNEVPDPLVSTQLPFLNHRFYSFWLNFFLDLFNKIRNSKFLNHLSRFIFLWWHKMEALIPGGTVALILLSPKYNFVLLSHSIGSSTYPGYLLAYLITFLLD